MDKPDISYLSSVVSDTASDADIEFVAHVALYIAHLEARVKELEATNVWQPIETAPRDGKRLLLFVPPYGPSTGHWVEESERWSCHSTLNRAAKPTHCRPLPSPPEAD